MIIKTKYRLGDTVTGFSPQDENITTFWVNEIYYGKHTDYGIEYRNSELEDGLSFSEKFCFDTFEEACEAALKYVREKEKPKKE